MTISTYISRFNSYDNQIFKNISIEQLKENRYLVKTEFVRLKEKPISFNYIIQRNEEKWRIISVIANGINDLSLKRAEYAAIIKKDGIEVLIKKLEQTGAILEGHFLPKNTKKHCFLTFLTKNLDF